MFWFNRISVVCIYSFISTFQFQLFHRTYRHHYFTLLIKSNSEEKKKKAEKKFWHFWLVSVCDFSGAPNRWHRLHFTGTIINAAVVPFATFCLSSALSFIFPFLFGTHSSTVFLLNVFNFYRHRKLIDRPPSPSSHLFLSFLSSRRTYIHLNEFEILFQCLTEREQSAYKQAVWVAK